MANEKDIADIVNVLLFGGKQLVQPQDLSNAQLTSQMKRGSAGGISHRRKS